MPANSTGGPLQATFASLRQSLDQRESALLDELNCRYGEAKKAHESNLDLLRRCQTNLGILIQNNVRLATEAAANPAALFNANNLIEKERATAEQINDWMETGAWKGSREQLAPLSSHPSTAAHAEGDSGRASTPANDELDDADGGRAPKSTKTAA